MDGAIVSASWVATIGVGVVFPVVPAIVLIGQVSICLVEFSVEWIIPEDLEDRVQELAKSV